MTDKFELNAQKRVDVGKGASRRLRREEGIIPAIVYGAKKEPLMIQLKHNDILKVIQKEAFFSSLLTLKIDGGKEQVVLKDIQRHPYKVQILHMDFLRIKIGEKIYMKVPLHFVGGDVAPGVKLEGGTVQPQQKEVEICCLPTDLPEFIDVDVSHLGINEGVNLSDLMLPKGVEIVALSQSPDNDRSVVTVAAKRKIIEKVEVAEEGEEKEVEEGTEKTEVGEKATTESF